MTAELKAVHKSGKLNPLEPSRPVKACNGIALPWQTSNPILLFKNPQRTVIFRTYEAFLTNGACGGLWGPVWALCTTLKSTQINPLKPTGYGLHQPVEYFNNCTLWCVLYLSENKQRLVPLTAQTDWFL
jgi:hypothetical protein